MLTYSSLLKIPLILVNIVSVHFALTPPNPPPQPEEMAKYNVNNAGDTIPLVQLRFPLIHKVHLLCPSACRAAFCTASTVIIIG